jgi:hypothetical protein
MLFLKVNALMIKPIALVMNIFKHRLKKKLGIVVHACNHSTQEAEAGGSLVPNQPG